MSCPARARHCVSVVQCDLKQSQGFQASIRCWQDASVAVRLPQELPVPEAHVAAEGAAALEDAAQDGAAEIEELAAFAFKNLLLSATFQCSASSFFNMCLFGGFSTANWV